MEPPQPPANPNRIEQRVIELLLERRGPRPSWLVVDAGHDCAVVASSSGKLALTADTLVQGVHFDHHLSAADVGYKTVAVSVSDLLATRAAPVWLVLALSLPEPAPIGWVTAFARGVADACAEFGVHLVGGDVTRTAGPIVVTATLGGTLVGHPRTRQGARVGDGVWVTGTLGLAALALAQPQTAPEEAFAALRRPVVAPAFALALDTASAAMDLSDGLAADLPRLCQASDVGVHVDAQLIPQAPALLALGQTGLEFALAGGDDYALLFTAPDEAGPAIMALGAAHLTKTTRIGSVRAEPGIVLRGARWPRPAFVHFAATEETT